MKTNFAFSSKSYLQKKLTCDDNLDDVMDPSLSIANCKYKYKYKCIYKYKYTCKHKCKYKYKKSQYPTCDDNFDGMMDPSLSVASHAGVVGEVAVPDSVDPQLRPIVHHLQKF